MILLFISKIHLLLCLIYKQDLSQIRMDACIRQTLCTGCGTIHHLRHPRRDLEQFPADKVKGEATEYETQKTFGALVCLNSYASPGLANSVIEPWLLSVKFYMLVGNPFAMMLLNFYAIFKCDKVNAGIRKHRQLFRSIQKLPSGFCSVLLPLPDPRYLILESNPAGA